MQGLFVYYYVMYFKIELVRYTFGHVIPTNVLTCLDLYTIYHYTGHENNR